MLYIEDDNSIVYFSKTQNKSIQTKDPFSICKDDFFFFEKDEMIELLNLQINMESKNNE